MEEPQARVKGRLYEVTLYRRLPAMPAVFMNNSRKNEKRKEDLWAAVSASTGTYSQPSVSNQQSFSPMALASVSSTNSSASTHASGGSSYGIGMTVGKKIVNKVVLFGGVNYLNQAINYGSSVTTFGMADRTASTMANYAMSASAAPVSTTSSYTTSSVSELVSVPVQAGYVIVEKKFGVQLNTGVATDFFIRNTITDQSGTYSRYTQSAGENSPYRTVNWAGLLGTEMSYRMASHYRFSIVPGMRYALNSMVKNESTNSNAFSWNIGFRFRYIFH
jgi:hypothetical protein